MGSFLGVIAARPRMKSLCRVTGRGRHASGKAYPQTYLEPQKKPARPPALSCCYLHHWLVSFPVPYSGRTCFGANRRRRSGCSVPSPCFASQMGMSGHHLLSTPGNCLALQRGLWDGGEGTVWPCASCGPLTWCACPFSPAFLLMGRDSVNSFTTILSGVP